MTQCTPEIGMVFKSSQMPIDDQWNSWTIQRKDKSGRFWAVQNREYACGEVEVKDGHIAKVEGKAWNFAYLLAQNEKYND